jgi:hypothetical protein
LLTFHTISCIETDKNIATDFLEVDQLIHHKLQHKSRLHICSPLVENRPAVPARKRLLSRLANRDNRGGTKGGTFCSGQIIRRNIYSPPRGCDACVWVGEPFVSSRKPNRDRRFYFYFLIFIFSLFIIHFFCLTRYFLTLTIVNTNYT